MRKPLLLLGAIIVMAVGLFAVHKAQTPQPHFAPMLGDTPVAAPSVTASTASNSLPDFLPREAVMTIKLIQQGGPFPHRQDGSVFANREHHLPARPAGYYHEYTVETPGENDRGARRIVTGGTPPDAWYYTEDHYQSFKSFEIPEQQP